MYIKLETLLCLEKQLLVLLESFIAGQSDGKLQIQSTWLLQ